MSTTTIIVIVALIFVMPLLWGLLKKPNKHTYKYQKRALLTNNELNFFRTLYPIANKRNLILFTKINLADLITAPKDADNRQASRNQISQKHVDFVLCDSVKINPILVIELDDKSHDNAKSKERDKVKNDALESAGIPILRTRSTNKLEEDIMQKLSTKTIGAKK